MGIVAGLLQLQAYNTGWKRCRGPSRTRTCCPEYLRRSGYTLATADHEADVAEPDTPGEATDDWSDIRNVDEEEAESIRMAMIQDDAELGDRDARRKWLMRQKLY